MNRIERHSLAPGDLARSLLSGVTLFFILIFCATGIKNLARGDYTEASSSSDEETEIVKHDKVKIFTYGDDDDVFHQYRDTGTY